MQRKQSKNLRKNIGEIQKMSEDRKEKKKHLRKGNCQGNLLQESYLVGQTKDTMRNTGQGWKEIGDNGKEKEQEDKEQWKQ